MSTEKSASDKNRKEAITQSKPIQRKWNESTWNRSILDTFARLCWTLNGNFKRKLWMEAVGFLLRKWRVRDLFHLCKSRIGNSRMDFFLLKLRGSPLSLPSDFYVSPNSWWKIHLINEHLNNTLDIFIFLNPTESHLVARKLKYITFAGVRHRRLKQLIVLPTLHFHTTSCPAISPRLTRRAGSQSMGQFVNQAASLASTPSISTITSFTILI